MRRRLGVGNATGLGMAPFLVRHPLLMHNWFHARETALARVRSLSEREAQLSARRSPTRSMKCARGSPNGAQATHASLRRSQRCVKT